MANLPSDELPSKFDVVVDGTGECLSLIRNLLYRATVVDSTKLLHRPFIRNHVYRTPFNKLGPLDHATRPCLVSLMDLIMGVSLTSI